MRETLKLLLVHYLLLMFLAGNLVGVYYLWGHENLLLKVVSFFLVADTLLAVYFNVIAYIKLFKEIQFKLYEI